ncbi:hypothetical protein GY31_13160 [Lysinibacillus sphaericus]|uniref:hypothetical protein n=1 Tax=Lysinibacillus TaxID=400634 RepID=UPI00084B83AD|nr:hypothetical protein [Lysinibacillus sphaericus]OEC01253.1 hypothetical protein GY31_13160 [Lysinibacillus sphaericus]
MGSFFVVQVKTGAEVETKEMLKIVLDRLNNEEVKAIYAMETYTEVMKELPTDNNLEGMGEYPISEFLHIKRIQTFITNLRISCEKIKENMTNDSLLLLEDYQKQIKSLRKILQGTRKKSAKIRSLLKGYVLVETVWNYKTLPSSLWHVIKSVPKVIGIPSKFNVPSDEINHFFENLDMTPQVEMEFDSFIASVAEIEKVKNELLHEANQVFGTERAKELYEQMEILDSNLETELTQIFDNHHDDFLSEQDGHGKDMFKTMLSSIKVSVQRLKEKVSIPLPLFHLLYPRHKLPNDTSFTRSDFLERVKTLILRNC